MAASPPALSYLARNLGAGARLALGMPVRRLAFRIDLAQLLLVLLFSSLIDVAGDWLRYGPDGRFSWLGAGNEFFTFGLLIAAAALIAIARHHPSLALAIPVIVLASAPVVQLGDIALSLVRGTLDIPQFADSWLAYVIPAWFVAMILRAAWVAFDGEGRRRLPAAIAAGIVLAAPTWLAPYFFAPSPWWESDSSPDEGAGAGATPVSELVQAAQSRLLDDALGALDDERPGVIDLYFVAFAADAREPALREDALHAQQVMDERWDTRGRSLVLANDPATLMETPFATVSNLREALREIGAAIDSESDVVMIYIAGRGGASGVEVSHPPLDLLPLAPSTLRALLDDAGIKRRIVVVSACRSAAFAQALADESTVVLAAGGGDDGACAPADMRALGDALFTRGLAQGDSFAEALAQAQRTMTEHGGKPALSIGSSMTDVLKALDRGNAARRNGRSV